MPSINRPSTRSKSHLPSRQNTSPAKKTSSIREKADKKTASPARKAGSKSSGVSVFTKLTLWWKNLPSERKLDIFGGVLVFFGLVVLLSLITPQRGFVFGGLVNLLFFFAGWGIFVLPLALIAVGLWLIFRNIKSLPVPSAERLTGIVLIYLNLLTFLNLVAGGGMDLAMAKKGGGYIGGLFESGLKIIVGKPGTLVIMAAWLLIGLGLTFDISTLDLLRRFYPVVEWVREVWYQWKIKWQPVAAPADTTSTDEVLAGTTVEELPSDFQRLQPIKLPLQPGESVQTGNATETETTASGKEDEEEQAGFGSSAVGTPLLSASAWRLPTIEAVLDPAQPAAIESSQDQDRARIIEETLNSFGAPAHVVETHRGPTVTQFGVEPDFVESRTGKMRVRVSKIISLADDLALALAASRIRIQAPVPGRNYVGIEVPNIESSQVTLRELLESESVQHIKSNLRFAVGKDVAGNTVGADLRAMPHLLIAGTTGSGKSVCINSILCAFLLNNTPYDLRLVLVDPKRVELTCYNGIPHLLTPVVVDADRVIGVLQWVLREMDSRYHKFSNAKVRNIQDFNEKKKDEHLPFLIVVIDELADLMMMAPDETERAISRLAQLARATGIHLVLATQRPSVNVVTGLIKANFPARIAFAVASGVDSRVILDQPGAERLLGRGDMLFLAPDASMPVRLQGAYVSDSEIQLLVDYWRFNAAVPGQKTADKGGGPIDTVPAGVPLKQIPLWEEDGNGQSDPVLGDAIDLVRKEGRASITMLERRMRIGYTRAARLIETMEEMKIVGPPQSNTQVREVLDYGQGAPPPED